MSDELNPQEGAVATEESTTAPVATEAIAEIITEVNIDAPVEVAIETPMPAPTDAVAAEVIPSEVPASEVPASEANVSEAEPAPAPAKQPDYDIDAIYAELVTAKNNKSPLEVLGLRRVRGGILVGYKNMPLFLPTSHLSLKSNPSENELLGLIQKNFTVHVHELNDADKTKVIVSRRRSLRVESLDEFKVGQIVEGKVVSLTDFGAFINLGSVDGMVHVSAMSRRRVTHPSEILQKGDTVRAVVKEINQGSQRLSLSMKDLEADPWTGAAAEFPAGGKHTGKVKSLTDFGAYIELKPGVEGLVHISEMSWARRIKHPSELFQAGQEITVQVLEISEEKHKVALGYKQTQPNPWDGINERFQVGQVVTGTVKEVINRGVVVNIADDIDAFMPRGKMHPSVRSQNAPFNVGDKIENVLVMDVVAENHSLILGMEGFDQGSGDDAPREPRGERGERGGNRGGGRDRGDRGNRGGRDRDRGEQVSIPEAKQDVSLADLLSDEEKRKLFGDDASS